MNQIEGDVNVGVFVDRNGEIEKVQLFQSSSFADLDNAALDYVKRLQFEPARLDGKPIGAWTKLVLRYRLDKRFFEAGSWLDRVLNLHEQANATQDSTKLARIHRQLYTSFNGLTEHVELYKNIDINRTIRSAVSRAVKTYWQSLWDVVPLPLALYDDFLYRYSGSKYIGKVEQELLRQITETEFLLRARAAKSRRLAKKSEEWLQLLRQRQQHILSGKTTE